MIAITDPRIEKYKTPYKYSVPVLSGSGAVGAFDEKAVDIPFVFWHKDKFYMLYTGFDGKGYQSALATSEDLLNWEHKAVILKKSEDANRWDHVGGAATWIIKENDDLWSLPKLRKIEGKYWMVYHSYPQEGYENGPAEIGLAWTEDEELLDWHFPDAPVFSWKDGDDWEKGGLYKACIVRENDTWYMFYNAKDKKERWIEQTGVAFSKDLKTWERCPENPVLRVGEDSWDQRFVSDPYVVKDKDTWVNFYFGYGKVYEDGHAHAQEGLALSKDLIHWEKVQDPIITFGKTGDYDSGHAHKASILYHQGRLCHFYCGTSNWRAGFSTDAFGEYRTICVASDKPFENDSHIRPFLWMKGEGKEAISKELEQIQACGIKEVCLESRPHPDFCKKKWWDEVSFVLEKAKKNGMRVWILDDDKFPTGHANGAFARQQDKKKWYLAERHMDIMGPCRQGAVLVEPFYKSGKLLGIIAVPKPDGDSLDVSMEGCIELTDKVVNGFVYFDLPKGPYRLFVLYTTHEGGGRDDYMNLIDEDSVRVLIDEVYEAHYAHFKEYFGSTLAGFFSDEPELGNVKGYPFDDTLGKRDQKLPWSSELSDRLLELWGEDFLKNMISLWYESGMETARIRSEYMDCMSELVYKCFSGQIGRWCQEHGVEYIGHIIEDDNAHTRMGCSIGHYFREMQGQQMAGIDVVHHQIVPGFTEPVHQWIAGDRDGEFFHFGLAKLGASAAHLQENKRGRALCEIFGNYGWAEGISFMKWLTDHMLVRGINEFTPHAFSMTYPDKDCPPHFYAGGNNPGFECFTYLIRYMNSAAKFLSKGVHVAEAAILYHAEAEWAGGEYELYQKAGRNLMEHQMDYDIVTEDMLMELISDGIENHLTGNGFEINGVSFSVLVLPYRTYIDDALETFVIKAGMAGIRIIQIKGCPEKKIDKEKVSEEFSKCVTVVSDYKDLYRDIPRKCFDVCGGNLDLRSFAMKDGEELNTMWFNESVDEKISFCIKPLDVGFNRVKLYDPWNEKNVTYKIADSGFLLELEPGEAVFLDIYKENNENEYPLSRKMIYRQNLDISWKLFSKRVSEDYFEPFRILQPGEYPALNGIGYNPAFAGAYRYCGSFLWRGNLEKECVLHIPEASDCVKVILNNHEIGWVAGFPGKVDLTGKLLEGENDLILEVRTTLVWTIKDGASTHLQVSATGITREPYIGVYELEYT